MNDALRDDVDVDWVEGLDEPSGLLWTDDGWSLADSPVTNAVHRYGVVSGLDSQGCSTRHTDFELQRLFNIDECGSVDLFAQRAGAARLIEAVAA